MKLFKINAEARFVETMVRLRGHSEHWHVQHYHLSCFTEAGIADDFTDILVGYVIEQFADKEGYAFVCADKDVLLVCPMKARENMDIIQANFMGHISGTSLEKLLHPLTSDYPLIDHWSHMVDMGHIKNETNQVVKTGTVSKGKLTHKSLEAVKETEQRMLAKGIDDRKVRDKPCVLLVEDDPLSLHLAKRALEKNFTIATASNAADARIAYMAHVPDVVFLDIGLPDATGHVLLSEIKHMDQEAYVVMLSGNSYQSDIVNAMKRGAKGFVGKPFSRAKLLQYVAQSPHCSTSDSLTNLH